MPPDRDSKTEPATARRRQEAREEGQVARSQDLPSAVLLLGSVVALKSLAPRMLVSLQDIYATVLGSHAENGPQVLELFIQCLNPVAWILIPILLLVVAFTLATNLVQVGWTISYKALTPDLTRLDPVKGLGKLVDMRALVKMGMSILKMASVAVIAGVTLWQMRDGVIYAAHFSTDLLVGYTGQILYTLCMRLAMALLILALIDYIWQRYQMEQDIKMSKEEVKEEFRRMEGDPQVKNRRRQVQMQMAMHRMRYDVPKADVVITNPTHLAIAIKYDAESMSAPRVLAKGEGYMAQMIRQIAAEHAVPIIERKPLAQAIYKTAEVGQEIPKEFYKAIAEVLAYVYELSGRGYRRKSIPA